MSRSDRAAFQFERLSFFSDAVFAIAITLLVLDVKLPPVVNGSFHLGSLVSKLIGFIVSFSVIGVYWLAHHRLFGTLRREDARLSVTNLIFLATIVFLPFPTGVLAEFPLDPPVVCLYAGAVGTVGLAMIALVLAARRPVLMQDGETRSGTIYLLLRSAAPPLVFFTSLGLAAAGVVWAPFTWFLVPPALALANHLGVSARTALSGPVESAP